MERDRNIKFKLYKKFMQIKFKKSSELAKTPVQNTSTDAWYDLFSTENCILKSGERKLIKTNISCAIEQWYYGRIAPRSGLAYKHGIDTLAGVIDAWYRWDIGVILINFDKNDFEINVWDKIAQFIIEKCHYVDRVEVENLDETVRGGWGFWSSG